MQPVSQISHNPETGGWKTNDIHCTLSFLLFQKKAKSNVLY